MAKALLVLDRIHEWRAQESKPHGMLSLVKVFEVSLENELS
jgi:hypothetical protein